MAGVQVQAVQVPFDKPDPSADPRFNKTPEELVPNRPLRCPKCGETEKINGRSLQYELRYHCDKCGNEWSGGMGVARPDMSDWSPRHVAGLPPRPEDEEPAVQYTGASFRDPSRSFDYDGED